MDESCRVKLTFQNGVTANLSFTLAEFTPIEARISGDKGEIMLPNRWYQPVNVLTTVDGKTEENTIEFKGNGYNYQVEEVHRCMDQNLIESDQWSHQHSLDLMKLMDEIRRQCGILYAEDK